MPKKKIRFCTIDTFHDGRYFYSVPLNGFCEVTNWCFLPSPAYSTAPTLSLKELEFCKTRARHNDERGSYFRWTSLCIIQQPKSCTGLCLYTSAAPHIHDTGSGSKSHRDTKTGTAAAREPKRKPKYSGDPVILWLPCGCAGKTKSSLSGVSGPSKNIFSRVTLVHFAGKDVRC